VSREYKLFVLLSVAFVAAVLRLDAPGVGVQLLLAAATAAFVFVLCRRLEVPPWPIAWCVAVATTGEVILSAGWELYSYQHAVIPLYVPPGHALFYALAVVTARQPRLVQHQQWIVRATLAVMGVMAIGSLLAYRDTWGLLWSAIAIALILRSNHQLMLCACVAFTVLLEWGGTWNGNWRWAAEVPFVGLTTANPPSGVGLLYVVLDLVVTAIKRSPRQFVLHSGPTVPSPRARGEG
jgi:hypothetical protein